MDKAIQIIMLLVVGILIIPIVLLTYSSIFIGSEILESQLVSSISMLGVAMFLLLVLSSSNSSDKK